MCNVYRTASERQTPKLARTCYDLREMKGCTCFKKVLQALSLYIKGQRLQKQCLGGQEVQFFAFLIKYLFQLIKAQAGKKVKMAGSLYTLLWQNIQIYSQN